MAISNTIKGLGYFLADITRIPADPHIEGKVPAEVWMKRTFNPKKAASV